MRYFVTLDDRDFPLALSEPPELGLATVVPGRPSAQPLRAEIVSRGGAGRATLVLVEGHVFRVSAERELHDRGSATRQGMSRVNGRPVRVVIETELERRTRPARAGTGSQDARVSAPMPGRVVKIHVRPGDRIVAGAALMSIEAMKMENELSAPCGGLIVRVAVEAGVTVEADQELISIEPA